jgi:hypothetical protein
MFIGGSYHDRDNPHMWGVSHGQLIVFITIVCNQKEGRQQSSSRKVDQTSVADDEMRTMIKMMKIFFYRGTGTKCTENQISNKKRCDDDDKNSSLDKRCDDDHGDTSNLDTTNNSTNKKDTNNKNKQQPKKARPPMVTTPPAALLLDRHETRTTRTRRTTRIRIQRPFTGTTTNNNNNTNTSNTNTARAPPVSTPVSRLDRHEETRTTGMTGHGTNKQGRMTTMGMTETIPPATGTLDRKTSQASPKACLYNNQHKTREA